MKRVAEVQNAAHQKLYDATQDIAAGDAGYSCFGAVLCAGAVAMSNADGTTRPFVYASFTCNDDAGPEYGLALSARLRELADDIDARYGEKLQ